MSNSDRHSKAVNEAKNAQAEFAAGFAPVDHDKQPTTVGGSGLSSHVLAYLPLQATGADAVAWHLEQGQDNGGISRNALALALRDYANTFREVIAALSRKPEPVAERCAICEHDKCLYFNEQARECVAQVPICSDDYHGTRPCGCKCEFPPVAQTVPSRCTFTCHDPSYGSMCEVAHRCVKNAGHNAQHRPEDFEGHKGWDDLPVVAKTVSGDLEARARELIDKHAEMIRLRELFGMPRQEWHLTDLVEDIAAFAASVQQSERERCVKIVRGGCPDDDLFHKYIQPVLAAIDQSEKE